MAAFKWEIYDSSAEPVLGQVGGEVELKEVQPCKANTWGITPPDDKVVLEPITGGTVGRIRAPAQTVVGKALTDRVLNLRSLSTDKKLFRIVVLLVVALLGFGFLAVVANDIRQGKLDFQTYTMFLSSFLAGMGVGKVSKIRAGQGDGSG